MRRNKLGEQPSQGPWSRCPKGSFADLGEKLRRRMRRRVFLRTTAGVALTVLSGGLAFALWPKPSQKPAFAGITCAEVLALAEPFRNGQVSERQREQIVQHVRQCPMCGPRFRETGIRI